MCIRDSAEAEQAGSTSLSLFPVPLSGDDKERFLFCSPDLFRHPQKPCNVQLSSQTICGLGRTRRSLQGVGVTEYTCKTVLLPAMLKSVTVETCLTVGATLQQDVRKQELLLYINVLFRGRLSCKITSHSDWG